MRRRSISVKRRSSIRLRRCGLNSNSQSHHSGHARRLSVHLLHGCVPSCVGRPPCSLTFNVQAVIRRASSMADKTSWTKPLARMAYGDCIAGGWQLEGGSRGQRPAGAPATGGDRSTGRGGGGAAARRRLASRPKWRMRTKPSGTMWSRKRRRNSSTSRSMTFTRSPSASVVVPEPRTFGVPSALAGPHTQCSELPTSSPATMGRMAGSGGRRVARAFDCPCSWERSYTHHVWRGPRPGTRRRASAVRTGAVGLASARRVST